MFQVQKGKENEVLEGADFDISVIISVASILDMGVYNACFSVCTSVWGNIRGCMDVCGCVRENE